ncbi:MAG: polysaccharide biosynthesis tyrosine autokinase [Acidobacteria bacterium]|nr:polysaccharide biosynthesis tyrosine autokinase [Acidobacteriota bacterium]
MAEFEYDLRDIFRVLKRRKWVLILAPIFVATLTYWISATPPAVYEAESVVKISRVAANMQGLLLEALSWYEGDNIATQSEIITSQKIKVRVALRLAEEYPEFREITSLLPGGEETDYDALEKRIGDNPELAGLISGISVEAERKGTSDIVGIRTTGSSEKLAIDTANYTAEEFVNYNTSERNKEIRQAVRFIEARIVETEQELSKAEGELEEFKREHTETLSLQMEEVGALREQIESLGRKITNLEESVEQLDTMTDVDQYFAFSPAFTDVEDPQIAPLEQQVLQLLVQINQSKRERSELVSYLTEESREVRLNALQTKELEKGAQEIIASLLRRYAALGDELIQQRRALVERQDQLQAVPEVIRQLESLQGQVALKREAITLLQRRLQDAEIQKAGEIQEISIVERATSAGAWPQPSRLFKALLGMLIGTIMGGVFAMILESMDTSIGTIEDVERYVELPVLGVIPHLDTAAVSENVLRDDMGSDVNSGDLENISTLCTHFDLTSPVSEAFRSMRAQLEVLLKRNNWKTLMVTSSVLREGKTNTACNLAIVFAQAGHRTMLIDADVRRPRVHKLFGLSNTPGLTEVLLGVTDWENATRSMDDLILGKMGLNNTQITPGLEYLLLLTSGRKVDRPAELLNLERFGALLSEMRDHYDIIIVDVPPALPVAEASQLSPGIDATLLAYQIGRIGREVLNRCKSRLEAMGGNVVGLVMNDIEAAIYDTRDSGYYGGYKYRYGDPAPASGFLARLKEGLDSVSQFRFRRTPVTPQPLVAKIVTPPPPPAPDIPSQNMASCVVCGKNFDAARSDARFCSSACRQKAYRARKTRQSA